MQIVIDMPDGCYEELNSGRFPVQDAYRLVAWIKNGTPLPKGHGRLIDEKEVEKMIEVAKVNSEHSKTFAENIIKFTPTIIKADKVENEEREEIY